MKWIKENKLIASLTGIFALFASLFTALDKGFDFWEKHVAVDMSKPKVNIRNENTLKDMGVKYSDITSAYPDRKIIGRAQ